MGKGGGGGGQPTQQNVTQTNLPEYAKPYYEELMARTQAESIKPYQAYGGQRVAGLSAGEQAAQAALSGMTTPAEFGQAQQTYADITKAAQGMSYTPTTFKTDYAVTPYTAGTITSGYQAGTITDPGVVEKYMSPYIQNVLDVQRKEAQKAYQEGRAGTAAEAVKAGACGGSRFGVREAQSESEMLDRLAREQAQTLQEGYGQAVAQFGAEQGMQQAESQQATAAQQATEQFRQSAEQLNESDRQFLANQAMQVATNQEAANQFAATYGQQALQIAQSAADAQVQTAQAERNLEMQKINLQNTIGAQERAIEQQRLDQAYQDFVNARDYERQQIAFYNAAMRGIPIPVQQETIAYQPTAGIGTQLAGAGLAGLGLSNVLGGG